MEPEVGGSAKRRGRKRKGSDVHTVTVDSDGKKKAVETRSIQLVGRYVRKEFEGNGVFLGKIMFYDSGLYRINYEDGDLEDLDSGELKTVLIDECSLIGEWSERKENLDKLLESKECKNNKAKVSKVENPVDQSNINQVIPPLSELINGDTCAIEVIKVCDGNNDVDMDSDSLSDTFENGACPEVELPPVPPPELPSSSGHIGISEKYVSHLFSVHSFLRSFSVPLFLYPFGLDDFVGALNCSVANTLLDSVHVALMCVLKRHFEKLSTDGSEIALKCLSFPDWSLLDTVTWPIYLAHYLMVMGYTTGPDWKGFYTRSLHGDYYTLSAGMKLVALQILCDDVLDSEELRAEMDMREELEVGVDIDTSSVVVPIGGPRRVHPRYSKTSAGKDREPIQSMAKPLNGIHLAGFEVSGSVESPIDEDGNGDECRLCGMDGLLLCCDGCPSSYHARCLGLNKAHMSVGSWFCPECKINETEPKKLQGTTLEGGQSFGVDPYGQLFIASGYHLLILKTSLHPESTLRYYNSCDIPKVVYALCSKVEHVVMYSEICRGVMKYWELPEAILPCNVMPKVVLQLANDKESGESAVPLHNLLNKSIPEMTKVENTEEFVRSGNSLDIVSKSGQPGLNNITTRPTSFSGLVGQTADPSELSQRSNSGVSDTVSHTTNNSNVSYSLPVNGTSLEAKVFLPRVELSEVGRKVDENLCNGYLYTGSQFKRNSYINHYLHGDFAASAAANLAILSSEENQGPKSRSSDNRRKFLSAGVSLQVKAFSSAALRFFWPNTERKIVEVPRERCSWCFSCKAPGTSRRGCLLNAAVSNAVRGAMKLLAGVRPMKNGDGRLPGIATYILFMEESLRGLLVGLFLNDTFRKRWRRQVEEAATCNVLKILLLELEENIRTIAFSGDWSKHGSTQSSVSQIETHTAGSTQKRRPGRRGRKASAAVEVVVDDSHDVFTDFAWWRGDILSKLMSRRGNFPYSVIRKAARHGSSIKIPGIQYVEGSETLKTSRQFIWRSAVEMSRNTAQLALQVRYLDTNLRWSDFVRPEQTPSDGKGLETEASSFRNAFICDKKSLENEIRYCVAFGNQKHLPSRVMKSVAEIEQIQDGQERYWFSEACIPLYLIKEYEENVGEKNPVDVLSKLQKGLQRQLLKASHKNIFLYLFRKQDNTGKIYCCSCQQDVLYRDSVQCSACQGFCHLQCSTSSTGHMNENVEFTITCNQCRESRIKTQVEKSNGSVARPLPLQGQEFPNAVVTEKSGKIIIKLKGLSASAKTKSRPSVAKSKTGSASAKKSKNNNKNWGLIWRKNDAEDTGVDFRLKYILNKGNPDSRKPSCRLCAKPYNPDLTYIYCETCQHWFHADALEFDESKFFQLVGFKCCKCRRIRSPECPYLDPEKKKKVPKDQNENKQLPKMEVSEVYSDSSFISEYSKEEASDYAFSQEDPLLISLSELDQCDEENSEVDYGWNDAPLCVLGPQKLPVRRHIKQEKGADFNYPADPLQVSSAPFEANVLNSAEKLYVRRHTKQEKGADCNYPADSFQVSSAPFEPNVLNSAEKLPVRRNIKRVDNTNCYSANNSFQIEPSNPLEVNAVNSVMDLLSPHIQWDVSKENFDDGIILDYDCLGYDETEFEPQTYFSFNELLDSDENGRGIGNESSVNVIKDWENSFELQENGSLELYYNQEEPIYDVEETGLEIVACNICFHTEPYPDLSCQKCGKWIHKHCSPWIGLPYEEQASWTCDNCRVLI